MEHADGVSRIKLKEIIMLKKLSALALVLLMILSLAACTAPASTPSEAPAQTDAEQEAETESEAAEAETSGGAGPEMKFMWWGNDSRHEATQKMVELYNETFGANITTEFMAWDGFWDKLPVLSASESMPDILQMDSAYIHTYVNNGALMDITDKLDLTDIMTQEQIDIYKIDGVLYGAPVGTNGMGCTYLKPVLDEYGIEYPYAGWTWEEFIDWAKDAADKLPDGVWIQGDPRASGYENLQNYVEANYGYKILGFDGSFNFNKEHFIEYFTLWQELADAGVVPPADVSMSFTDGDATSDGWINKQLLLRFSNIGNVDMEVALLPEEEQTTVGVASAPVGEYGGGWYQSTMFYCVGANCQHPDEAVDFIKWVVSDIEAGKVLQTVRGMPVSEAVYDAIKDDMTVGQQLAKSLQDAVAPYATAYWNNTPNEYADWVNEFKACGESIMLGEMGIEEAADHLYDAGMAIYESLNNQ
jgi:multiple sugar transport system substrate-binding protein